MVCVYYIGILYAYSTRVGYHKLRLESYHVMFLQYVAATRGYDRQLVDFYAHAVAYETGVLAVAHVIGLESGCLDYLVGFVP